MQASRVMPVLLVKLVAERAREVPLSGTAEIDGGRVENCTGGARKGLIRAGIGGRVPDVQK